MRKTAILIVLLLAYNGLCFAQSTGNENRIIGSWQLISDGEIWVFSNNGTMTMATRTPVRYGITGTKLAIDEGGGVMLYDYSIPTDGRTLIVSISMSGTNYGYCFTIGNL